ncbi:MAG: hypothetical protein COT81_02935 [Candidatus Buchananbacteria bacterium CG10_big_fil_rev_8_21_14_0_10_42_9]|uniref:Uncharacterized protein n=1 Tax=Candidatus Buchananbacteria bacterium CG10_big_fil_rev_8_21_14_0_10_42_9 TaxID=1974526 RepID=A0A2H0W1C6_9BACT|nr:MAG: hypothetical protein COT81_02935 [Candidatus Buchananbacteria bacterium CG10_big_fil_rev_8_21_14_0_10_42_9]
MKFTKVRGFALVGLLVSLAIVVMLAAISFTLINQSSVPGSGVSPETIVNQADQVEKQVEERNSQIDLQPNVTKVQIENDFGSKIVYTTDASLGADLFKADCQARGGEFNECGSPCAPGSEICITVCAYTCENL